MMKIPIHSDIQISKSPIVKGFLRDWRREDITHITASGPRRCGKTVHIWMLLLYLIERVPGLRVCVLRSEAVTLRRTILRTLEDKILKYPPDDARNPFRLFRSPLRIEFENRAIIDFIGFDDAGKVQGGEYDVVFFNEVVREQSQEALSDLMATMAGGSAGNLVVKGEKRGLFIGDCNPDSEYHWYYQMYHPDSDGGSAEGSRWYSFLHKEQPLLYDWKRLEYTRHGERTVEDLLRAYPPGYNRQRMVYGEFCAAAGLVYPLFNAKAQVKHYKRSDFPDDQWNWCRAVDYGWNDPNVCDLWALRKDRQQAVLFKEIYKSKLPVDAFGKMINEMCKSIPNIMFTVTDHSPDHNEELRKMGIGCVNADKSILRNINLVREAFGDDKLRFNSDLLWHEPDAELRDQSKPTNFLEEIVQYRHQSPEDQRRSRTPDLPLVSCSDHSMNCTEYFCQRVWGGGGRFYLKPMVSI